MLDPIYLHNQPCSLGSGDLLLQVLHAFILLLQLVKLGREGSSQPEPRRILGLGFVWFYGLIEDSMSLSCSA